ncbi:MAG: hypothetical protein ACP5OF_01490 [bacterium]
MRRQLFGYYAPFTGLNKLFDPELIKDSQSPDENNVSHFQNIISPALGIEFFSKVGSGYIQSTISNDVVSIVGTDTLFTQELSLYQPLGELADVISIGGLRGYKITGITDDTHATGNTFTLLDPITQSMSYNISQIFPNPIIKLDTTYLNNQFYTFAITNKFFYRYNTTTKKFYATYYSQGTVTTDGTTTTVVGTGTKWKTYANAGSSIIINNTVYTVNSVTDDTHIEINAVPPALTGVAYKLYLKPFCNTVTTTTFLNNGKLTYYVASDGGLYKYDDQLDCFYVYIPQWATPSGTADYTTGTVTTDGTTTTVVGTGTAWSSVVVPGSIIQISNINFIVMSVIDDTHLTVNFVPPAVSGASYKIFLPKFKILSAELIAVHENHLVLGRVVRENSAGDYFNLYFSDINNDIIWGGDATTNDADIISFQISGNQIRAIVPLFQYLVVFLDNSIQLLTYQGLPIIYTRQTVNQNIGTIYPFACVSLNNIIFFIGNDNVYIFDGNSAIPIGDEIKNDLFNALSSATNVQGIYDYIRNSYGIIISTGAGSPFIYTYNTLTKSWYKISSIIQGFNFYSVTYIPKVYSQLTWANYNIVMESSPYKWNQLMQSGNVFQPIAAIWGDPYCGILTYGDVIINILNAITGSLNRVLWLAFNPGKTYQLQHAMSQMQYWISKPFMLSKDGREVLLNRIKFVIPNRGRVCRIYCTLYYGKDKTVSNSISNMIDLNVGNIWDLTVRGIWFQIAIDADVGEDNIAGYDISGIEFYFTPPLP